MGLRSEGLPSQSASIGSGQGDFESSFSDILGTESSSTIAPIEKAEQAQEYDPLDRVEESTRAAREKWKMQKRIKDLEMNLQEATKKGKPAIDMSSDNPLKELRNLKGWSRDDIVQKALDAMEDEGMSEKEAIAEVKTLSQEEIIAKVKEELKKEALEERENSEADSAIKDFRSVIDNFSKEYAAEYPLIDGLGGQDAVFNMIEQQFSRDEEEFGTEYAQKNIMGIDKAAKIINDSLAQSVVDALKSDHVRKFILANIKEDNSLSNKDTQQLEDFFQSEDDTKTLTNSAHRRVTDPKDSRELTEDERFAQAFSYLT